MEWFQIENSAAINLVLKLFCWLFIIYFQSEICLFSYGDKSSLIHVLWFLHVICLQYRKKLQWYESGTDQFI